MTTSNEKELQQSYSWARSQVFSSYNHVLGYYQAKACLEHARGHSSAVPWLEQAKAQ